MTARPYRYRVRFAVKFDITIEAPSDQAAKVLATEMEALPWSSWVAAADTHNVSCVWNTIEPIKENGHGS